MSGFQDCIRVLGGEVVSKVDNLPFAEGKVKLIITEARVTQEFELYEGEYLLKLFSFHNLFALQRTFIFDGNLGVAKFVEKKCYLNLHLQSVPLPTILIIYY